jgi:hypothetical protein
VGGQNRKQVEQGHDKNTCIKDYVNSKNNTNSILKNKIFKFKIFFEITHILNKTLAGTT